MNPVKVYIVAATGPAELLRQFRWNEKEYPSVIHQQVPRGLVSFSEDEDGMARGVWYSTLEDYVKFPAPVTVVSPHMEEVEAAKEQVAVQCVRRAVNSDNYRRVAKLFLSRHRQARKEATEFDAICAAASEEIAAGL